MNQALIKQSEAIEKYTFGGDTDEDLLLDQAVEYLKEGLECE